MKELEDQNWFPSWLRNFQTEFIGLISLQSGIYSEFITHINKMHLPEKMSDLCSGSGQPALHIFKNCDAFQILSLSDKYPNRNIHTLDSTIKIDTSDVTTQEFTSNECYTMFNAFHHFNDSEKIKIVDRLSRSGSFAFIVEILEPTLLCLLKVLVATTIGVVVFTPFVRPLNFKRLFFTYVLPVNIITILVDGVISVCKSRFIAQYKRLFKKGEGSLQIFQLQGGIQNLIVIQIEPKR
jgi:hypothetical protein